LSMLQVNPAVGRGFLPEEDSFPGKNNVAVISDAEWQRDFGRAANILGRTVFINGHAFTVVGVMPQEFRGIQPVIEPQIYIPRMTIGEPNSGLDVTSLTNRSARFANIVARLKPGITLEQANEDIARIAGQLEREHFETNKDIRAVVMTQLAFRQAGGSDN